MTATDSAPATPVPATTLAPAAPPVPGLVTRAAEAVAAAPAAVAQWWTTLSPALNQSIVAIVTAVVTLGMTVLTQHYVLAPAPKGPIVAADRPAQEPARIVLQPFDGLEARAAAIEAKLDLVLKRLPEEKAPVVAPKRTKTSAVR